VFHLENSLTLFLLPAAVTITLESENPHYVLQKTIRVATTDMDCHVLQIELMKKTCNIAKLQKYIPCYFVEESLREELSE